MLTRIVCCLFGHRWAWLPVSDRSIAPGQPYMGLQQCQRCRTVNELRVCVDGAPLYKEPQS